MVISEGKMRTTKRLPRQALNRVNGYWPKVSRTLQHWR